jgi:hypothetical protein
LRQSMIGNHDLLVGTLGMACSILGVAAAGTWTPPIGIADPAGRDQRAASSTAGAAVYYVSTQGNDGNNGLSSGSAWRTIGKVNSIGFGAGDQILFEGGAAFSGSLAFDSSDTGTATNPIIVSSYGAGRAEISAGGQTGLSALNSAGIEVKRLRFTGDGTYPVGQVGIFFYTTLTSGQRLQHVRIDECEVSGFQTGIKVAADKNSNAGFEDVAITRCSSHGNQNVGIAMSGWVGSEHSRAHRNLYIADCVTYDNPGGVNNTGSGITVADCENGIVEYCESYGNGYANTGVNTGGPCGIWLYRATNIVIQHCISHNNRTGANTFDGGGFDFDGGSNRCVLQHNYSYENAGPGYLVCQFDGAPAYADNTIRYNVSENDCIHRNSTGAISFAGFGPFAVSGTKVYNNVVYVSLAKVTSGTPRCVRYETGAMSNNVLFNNVFIAADGLDLVYIPGQTGQFTFNDNLYWSVGGTPRYRWGGTTYTSLAAWRAATGQERAGGVDVGVEGNPLVAAPGNGEKALTPRTLASLLTAYRPQTGSPAIDAGRFLSPIASITGGGSSFVVGDSTFFQAQRSTPNAPGDLIQLWGTAQKARVVSVDHAARTLQVDTPVTWTQNQGVAMAYLGAAPDIGAWEYGATVGGAGFVPLAPCRVLDTRVSSGAQAAAPIIDPGARRVFTVAGECGVPAGAVAVSANLTVVGASAAGDLRVTGGHLATTITSGLSIPLGRARANNAIVQLSTAGDGTIAATNASAGSVHFILDVNGYFL